MKRLQSPICKKNVTINHTKKEGKDIPWKGRLAKAAMMLRIANKTWQPIIIGGSQMGELHEE